MILVNQSKLLIILTISLLFLFPSFGAANDSLEKTTITIDRTDKSIGEILEEIEKQTNYTFKILDFCEAETLDEIMSNKKSLVLHQASLDQAISRLLKDFNYSIISDDNKKTLTLVLMNKENKKGGSSAVASKNNEPVGLEEDSMDAVTVAFAEYYKKDRSGNQPDVNLEEQEATTMDGATEAFEEFNANMQNGAIQNTDQVEQEVTTMDGATKAFEEFNTNMQSGTVTNTDQAQQEETTMDAVSEAFDEYNSNMQNGARMDTDQLDQEATSMDAVTEAFKQYNGLNTGK